MVQSCFRGWPGLGRAVAVLAVLASAVAPAPPASAAAAPPRDTARYACPTDAQAPFTDIAGTTHEASIRCMARYGFINGTTSTTFSPGSSVTRGQLASFLARGLAYTGAVLDTSDHGFADLGSSPHRPAIDALANLNVVAGTSAATFEPGRPVTRGQAASMVARLLRLGGALPDGADAFSDDQGSVHEASTNALAAAGIVGGVTPDQYRPNDPITRGAAASILARVQDFAVEQEASPPIGPPTSTDALLLAALSGDSVVPGPGDAAVATIELMRSGVAGLLCARWTVAGGFASAPTEAHIHAGSPGTVGPVVLTLPTPAASSGTDLTTCAPGLSQAAIDAVFANPTAHHVDVHTGSHPGAAVRGQLAGVDTPLGTVLSPAEVVPGPGTSGATGDVTLEVLDDGTTLCGAVFYVGSGAATAAHLHEGTPGTEGPEVVTLPPVGSEGTGRGCVGGLDPGVLGALASDPASFYVDVHTTAGSVRGQLGRSALVATSLAGGPGGDPDGSGEAYLDLVGDGLVCFRLTVRGVATPLEVHILDGLPEAGGNEVAALPAPTFNTSAGCTEIPPAAFAALVARPTDHYVDVHTLDAPAGALRGRLALQ